MEPAKQDKDYNGYTYAQTPKGFYQTLGYQYFKADMASFTGTVMIVFRNDKKTRKNDGQRQPNGG
jgi:hypothetical protein